MLLFMSEWLWAVEICWWWGSNVWSRKFDKTIFSTIQTCPHCIGMTFAWKGFLEDIDIPIIFHNTVKFSVWFDLIKLEHHYSPLWETLRQRVGQDYFLVMQINGKDYFVLLLGLRRIYKNERDINTNVKKAENSRNVLVLTNLEGKHKKWYWFH